MIYNVYMERKNSMLYKYYKVFPKYEEFEQLTPESWVFHNFLSEKECSSYISEAEYSGWGNIYVCDLDSLKILTERLKGLLVGDTDNISDFKHFKRSLPGQGMLPHIDVYGWQNDYFKNVVSDKNQKEQLCINKHSSYSTLLYFNDNYEGGEIDYPEYNISYKPKSGDLLIHTVEVVHGVRKVISGIRYSCQSNIDQDFYFPKNFVDNFNVPEIDELTNTGIYTEDTNFQYSVAAEYVINDRLREYKNSNPDISIYSERMDG
jgi:hypothetical protein